MTGLLIPDDWNEGIDGLCTLTVTVPNSVFWRANVIGQLTILSNVKRWDATTGDAETAASIGADIVDSAGYDCGP